MACYISSNDNRFYAALESKYGVVAPVTAAHRFPAVKLSATQVSEVPRRRDKTGTRTYQGSPVRLRRRTTFDITTYLTGSDTAGNAPGYGPLISAALGSAARPFGGAIVSSVSGVQVRTSVAHSLSEGMAVTYLGELRFAAAVVDASTFVLNAPFTAAVSAGAHLGATTSYAPAKTLPGVSVYDYWSPVTAVQRMLRGAAVNEFEVSVNGDFHEIAFRGIAADLVDSASFENGQGGLTSFPIEPILGEPNFNPVPGHLGQVWIGVGPTEFHTLTRATVRVENNIDARVREFGSTEAHYLVPGAREVSVEFELFSQDNESFAELYQAARQRSPISMMLQLGEIEGQLCGVNLKGFVPEVPEFLDDEQRLRWRFAACRAEGTVDDEIHVAFG